MPDLLVALLISLPLPLPQDAPAALRQALVRLACALDLSTPDEGWGRASFAAEARWTRDTWLSLRDAPPSGDAARFPPAAVCHEYLAANLAWQRFLRARQDFFVSNSWAYHDALCMAGQLEEIWRVAAAAQWSGNVASRRKALARLRELLGTVDYYSGTLPPSIPLSMLEAR